MDLFVCLVAEKDCSSDAVTTENEEKEEEKVNLRMQRDVRLSTPIARIVCEYSWQSTCCPPGWRGN
jgi:hypothetical protein